MNPCDATTAPTSAAIPANSDCLPERYLVMNSQAVIALTYSSFRLSAIAVAAVPPPENVGIEQ